MTLKNNFAKPNKRDELHENAASGNYDAIIKLINDGINIYKGTADNETPLHLAMLNGHREIATNLWDVYENDLKFIQQSLQACDNFWAKQPILIIFGAKNISSFTEFYVEYQKLVNDNNRVVDKTKCVVFLLKRDNLKPEKVLCLSPKSDTEKILVIHMIQCTLSNGVLNLNARTDFGWTLINSTTKAGATTIFNKLVNFGIERDYMDIALQAIKYGQADFLDEFHKNVPTNTYETFFFAYCLRILDSNKWTVFKYYVAKIMTEKQITWPEIVNYRLPFHNTTIFHYTVSNGLLELAEHLVGYEPNLHVKDIFGYGPFHELKWNYDEPEPYQRLILKIIEIDPNHLKIVDIDNFTLCHKLVSGLRQPELVRFFTKYSNAKEIFFCSQDIALKFIGKIIERGHFDTIRYLVDNNLNNEILYSILNHLARTKNVELFVYVMSLVEYDFTAPTVEKEYPLVTALENRNLEIFNVIWPKVKNGDLNNLFYDLLRCTIQKPGLNQLFDEILEKCSDLTNLNGRDKSLLHWSAIADNLYSAQELIKRNVLIELESKVLVQDKSDDENVEVDVLLPSHYAENVEMYELLDTYADEANKATQSYATGFTPLHNCMARQSSDETLKLIEYLIEINGNIDGKDYGSRSAIYYANDTKIAMCLLKFNPNLNCKDEDGNTPIHYAFKNNRPNVAYILLEHESVDYSIRNNDGWTYLRCLVTEQYDYGNLELVLSTATSRFRTYLMDHCNDSAGYETPLILEALKSNEILSGWLLNQPNLNVYVSHQYSRNTPLHVAFRYGRADFVDILIGQGLNINEQNVDGNTPLNLYCKSSIVICSDVLRRYLKHNPDVRIKNDDKRAPIFYLASKDRTGETVCELLARGAVWNIRREEYTAFDRPSTQLLEIFKFLLDE